MTFMVHYIKYFEDVNENHENWCATNNTEFTEFGRLVADLSIQIMTPEVTPLGRFLDI